MVQAGVDVAALTRILAGIAGGDPDNDAGAAITALRADGSADLADVLNRVHSEMSRLRRREHELTVLFSSARDLAETRDLDVLLSRLVVRAHELVGTDITYLSAFDTSTRELRVRKSVGAVTPEFQNLRVPPDKGLASRVAASRTAQWTSRYSDYAGGPHDSGIDEAVAAEGVVSILGVPMLAEDTVLGVLFAATRHERAFGAEEIALLSALADHASVVMQTAGILKQLKDSEENTQRALARLQDHVAARDRSNVVHQKLVAAVLTAGGFGSVAATVAEALGRAVAIVDADATPVAAAGAAAVEPRQCEAPAVRAAIATSRETGLCCAVDDPRSPVEVVAAITAGAQYYGALLLGHGDLALGPVDQRTVERAAQVCALMTLQQNAVDDADRRTRAELVADLVGPAPQRRGDLARRLRQHGLAEADLCSVVAVVVEQERRVAATRLLAALLPAPALVAEAAGLVVVLGGDRDPHATAVTLRHRLADHLGAPVLAICPPVCAGIDELPQAFGAALRTARLLDALGVTDTVVDTAEYELFGMLFGHDPDSVHRFIAVTLGPVLDYDATNGTDLTATLAAFVRNGASPTRTARAMNYHSNTILARLERITALLGDRWRDDEHLYRISTAVRLDELRRSGAGG